MRILVRAPNAGRNSLRPLLKQVPHQVLKYVYKALAYSKKVPYMTGEPKFAARKLNFDEADAGENVENVLVGEHQCGRHRHAFPFAVRP